MAMDLSRGTGGDLNNNLVPPGRREHLHTAVVDLSTPKREAVDLSMKLLTATSLDMEKEGSTDEEPEPLKPSMEGKGVDLKGLQQLLGLAGDPGGLESILPQLDMAALNLLCLARLQGGLGSRRPLPAHLGLAWGALGCGVARRSHRCEQPGCDKVRSFHHGKPGQLGDELQLRLAAVGRCAAVRRRRTERSPLIWKFITFKIMNILFE
jgi:hypothetical protein